MLSSRIFHPVNKSHVDMPRWFDEMSLRRLSPCSEEMFDHFRNDVCDTIYPVFAGTAVFPRARQ